MTTSHFKLKEFPDMRLFMTAALRYSLGRKSYAPGYFLDFLNENVEKFSPDSLILFEQDLKDFLKYYHYHKEEVHVRNRDKARRILDLIDDIVNEK